MESKLEVKAEPVPDLEEINTERKPNFFKFKNKKQDDNIQNINYMIEPDVYSTYEGLDIKRSKKNNLYGEYDPSRPPLREYY